MKHIVWLQGFDITTIMALPLLKQSSPDGSPRPGATCLLLIAASECAFLLWKLRRKRVLNDNEETQNRPLDPQEVRHRLIATLNDRLERDRILTSRKRYLEWHPLKRTPPTRKLVLDQRGFSGYRQPPPKRPPLAQPVRNWMSPTQLCPCVNAFPRCGTSGMHRLL